MPRTKVIFIVGCGHSGSTLLDLILDAHSQIAGVGEMESAQPDLMCTCGHVARECPVWHDAFGPEPWPRQEIYRPKFSFLLDRGAYRSPRTGMPIDAENFARTTVAVYRHVLERTHTSIIVDSSESIDRTEFLSALPEIEPVVIHLVRDGRAATWSYLRKYKKMGSFFFTWCFANMKVEIFRRRYKGTFIFVRYEDLVQQPEQELARLCAEIGIAYEPQMIDFRKSEHHQINGNRMRFNTDGIRWDEKWRSDMPLWLRALFDVCFGWMNILYMRRRD